VALKPNISQRVIGSLEIILLPLPEQRAISRALRAIQGAREARLREVALERERKAALMEHLFTHGTRGEATKMTEIGEMPESWKITKLGDVAKVRGGFAFKSDDYSKDGIPLLKISNVSFGKIVWEDISFLPDEYEHIYNQYLMKPNDLVMAITRPVVAQGIKVSMLSERDAPCLLNQRVCQFIGGDSIKLIYLFYVIHNKYFIDSIINGASGSQQPNISTTKVESISIGLPTSKEQNDITSILVACDAKISALDHEARLLQELFRAMLEELMSGALRADSLVDAASKGCQN
jgi:type I restriction enzyme, S subunit